jgi:hypothetical protein
MINGCARADGTDCCWLTLTLTRALLRVGVFALCRSCQVELFAWRCQLRRVVLTVFRANDPATRFYTRTLNYTLDDTDPALWEQDAEYQIADIVLPLITIPIATTTLHTSNDSSGVVVATHNDGASAPEQRTEPSRHC